MKIASTKEANLQKSSNLLNLKKKKWWISWGSFGNFDQISEFHSSLKKKFPWERNETFRCLRYAKKPKKKEWWLLKGNSIPEKSTISTGEENFQLKWKFSRNFNLRLIFFFFKALQSHLSKDQNKTFFPLNSKRSLFFTESQFVFQWIQFFYEKYLHTK